MIEFTPITWKDGEEPSINAENLNRIETCLSQLVTASNKRVDLENLIQFSQSTHVDKFYIWPCGDDFPYNSPSQYGLIIGTNRGLGWDDYFIAVNNTPKIFFGKKVNAETEVTWGSFPS